MGTIARFVCTQRTETSMGGPSGRYNESPEGYEPGPDQVAVVLEPVQRATDDNVEWSRYTPVGRLEMTITNPDAYRQFVVGQDYYLELRKVQPAKARSSSSE